jgi:tetratricopeptide (TPR) repeat protein
MDHVLRLALLMLLATSWALAQVDQLPQTGKEPAKSQAPPRYERDRETGESSSKNTQIDLSPPKDDVKEHPYSDSTTDSDDSGDVQEMHPWDPHRAAKNIEVGDFYFKRKNYRAALGRYQEALEYKPNDAEANFHLAQCFDKLNDPDQASAHYHEYLKILPQGVFAPDAHRALERLESTQANQSPVKNQPK